MLLHAFSNKVQTLFQSAAQVFIPKGFVKFGRVTSKNDIDINVPTGYFFDSLAKIDPAPTLEPISLHRGSTETGYGPTTSESQFFVGTKA
jgi:hypothetical protein